MTSISKYNLTMISPSSSLFEELEDIISISCPNECIVSIEKINNQSLEDRFNKCKQELIEKYKNKPKINVETCRVFHGSRDFKSIKNILAGGFDVSYSTVNVHGIGTYFAKNYSYSKSYVGQNERYKVMMICDIIVGKKVLGRSGQILDSNDGDTWVDNISNPCIYSIPNNDQCIPVYVVQFYKFFKYYTMCNSFYYYHLII